MTTMTTITKYALAELAGVSRQAITKAVREGRMPTMPDGRIDADDPVVRKYINVNRRGNGKGNAYLNGRKHVSKSDTVIGDSVPASATPPATSDQPKKRGRPPKPKQDKAKPKKDNRDHGLVSVSRPSPRPLPKTRSGYTDLDSLDSYDLDEAKLKAQIHKLEIETAIKAGQYIDRAKVEAFVGAIWSIDSSEWTQLANKVASELVGVVRSTPDANVAERRVIELIDRAVYASLDHEKSKLNKWLEKFKLPPIDQDDEAGEFDFGDTDLEDDE
jgi:hypothetical protein